ATLPDGTTKWLIYIRDWDFHWQDSYRYASPVRLPAGTRLTMEYTYDNSQSNPVNPNRPPKPVTYGQRTSDEMGDLWIQVLPREPADLTLLNSSLREKLLPQNISGYQMMLKADPDNVALHDDLALLFSEAGDLRQAARQFTDSLRLRPNAPAAHYNLGKPLLVRRDWPAAQVQLAWILATASDGSVRNAKEALLLAERAVRFTERQDARTLDVLAASLAANGDFDRAVGAAESALAALPPDGDPTRAAGIRRRLELYRDRKTYTDDR